MAEAAGAIRNSRTGYWLLNGLEDISDEEMMMIVRWGSYNEFLTSGRAQVHSVMMLSPNIRTTLPSVNRSDFEFPPLSWSCVDLEVVRFTINSDLRRCEMVLKTDLTVFSAKVREIQDILRVGKPNLVIGSPDQDSSLETLYLKGVYTDMSIYLSRMSIESVDYMVENANNSKAIVVMLHADVFARLTEELIEKAREKNIQFVTI